MNTPVTLPHLTMSRRRLGGLGLLLTAGLVTGACGGPDSSGGSTRTLRIGHTSPPNSMDPAKINQAFEWYINLAYDPLIYHAADGSLQPRLAESYGYLDGENREFEIVVREGVTFSDESPLTADVVARNIEYYREAGGQAVPFLAPIETVEVVDERTVRLVLSEPHPLVPMLFTQDYLAGNLISADGLADPDRLATHTAGAGPYVLDSEATIPNDRYVYRPNPHYWNPDGIRYDEVSIKVIPNPSTALSALRSGQVDVIQGDHTTAVSAREAGLEVAWTPLVFVGLAFADRDGSLLPPLGDLRVRQAINHALDRPAITAAIFGDYGTPTEQIVPPGWDGYNEATFYAHDLERARELLADAGYGDGFSLPVLTTPFANQEQVVLAIGDQLAQIGITLEITSEADTSIYVEKLVSGEFPAYGIGYGSQPIHLMGPGLFLPNAAVFNPRGSSDEQLQRLYDEAAAATPDERAELERELVWWLVEQAWFAPVSIMPVYFYSNGTVAGIEPTPEQPIASPVAWHPAENQG